MYQYQLKMDILWLKKIFNDSVETEVDNYALKRSKIMGIENVI